jgi:hypothetical protein
MNMWEVGSGGSSCEQEKSLFFLQEANYALALVHLSVYVFGIGMWEHTLNEVLPFELLISISMWIASLYQYTLVNKQTNKPWCIWQCLSIVSFWSHSHMHAPRAFCFICGTKNFLLHAWHLSLVWKWACYGCRTFTPPTGVRDLFFAAYVIGGLIQVLGQLSRVLTFDSSKLDKEASAYSW